MCGICGVLDFRGRTPQAEQAKQIASMLQKLQRRGPDAQGDYYNGPIALGHRRLSIIDLSDKANQPMHDLQHNRVLVFNGAIYNYPQLRQQLIQAGHQFYSSGDSEVILKAYAQWGKDCVQHLDGMFAFAIWDIDAQTLFLARDRLGIKPLYYSLDQNRFVFASNAQAMLTDKSLNTEFDPAGLHALFTLHAVVPAPMTLFKGLRKLAPATTLTVTANGDTQLEQYWQIKACRSNRYQTESEWIAAMREVLVQAVYKRKMIADVPVGVLLSGGLDSSLLVALLKHIGVDDLLTFSVGFENEPEEKGHEFEYSDAVVERFNTEHYKFRIANDLVLQRLPEVVDAMSEPIFGRDAVGFYLLSEQVSQKVKVVQSGQGADEVFGGYFWYQQMQQASGDELQRFAPFYFDRDYQEYLSMISPEYAIGDTTSELVRTQLTQADADTYIDQVLRFDVNTLIVDDPVKRIDNMTMAWGLEARVPFLDRQVVELAFEMPPELKLKNGGKHILKQIARGLLPDSVIDRPKGYFPVPALRYVRGDFLEFMRDILHSRAARERGIFQSAYVQMLLANPEKHLTRIQGSKLWQLALFEFWLQRHLH